MAITVTDYVTIDANGISPKAAAKKAYKHAHYLKNKARYNAASRAWNQAHPEKRKEIVRNYGQKNASRISAQRKARYHGLEHDALLARFREATHRNWPTHQRAVRRWGLANPEKRKEIKHRRRAREYGTTVGRVDLRVVLARHGRWCHLCLRQILLTEQIHFDHLIPLALGGAHTEDNIAPAHAKCNQLKGARAA